MDLPPKITGCFGVFFFTEVGVEFEQTCNNKNMFEGEVIEVMFSRQNLLEISDWSVQESKRIILKLSHFFYFKTPTIEKA